MSTILQNHYVLAVHDVRRPAEFYLWMLGFRIVAEPNGGIFAVKDGGMLMLGECPDDMPPSELGCHNYFAENEPHFLTAQDRRQTFAARRGVHEVEGRPFLFEDVLVEKLDAADRNGCARGLIPARNHFAGLPKA